MSATNNTTSNTNKVSADKQLDNIPDELKERDQWLHWGGIESKQPHWDGNIGISWSDPDDWHSFEEAVKIAREKGYGIGYVTATDSTNYDDGEYGVIDIDGGIADDGRLKDWVPTIERFVDEFYVEYSPSGTGIHIPFKGDLPSWWKDGQIGDHEGIDMLGNKFCTFTGDTEDAENPVADIDITPWLIEAYKAIHGEYPETAQAGSSGSESPDYDDDGLDDEMVAEALDHLDPDCTYSEWRDIAFAVHDYDSSSNGQSLFEDWSRGGEKYDRKAERQIETIWSNASQGSGITVATLVYKAQQNGWEPDFPTPNSGGETIPEGVVTPLHEHEGEYCTWDSNGDEPTRKTVTTYTIETNAILIDPTTGDKQLDLTIKPASDVESEYEVVVSPTVFNELRQYKKEIQTGTTTAFQGSTGDLNHIRQIVAHQTAPHRIATTKIGLQQGELVTPDGVYTGDDEDPQQRYVPTGNAIDSKWTLEDLDGFDEDEVQAIIELLPQTRDSERFLPILGWMHAALYTPQIREWEDEIPLVGVDADTGAGKTSIIGFMMKCLGMDGTPLSAQDTKFSLIKHLSASSSIPVWLDEYKPSDMQQYKLDGMQDLLRKTTRGGDETRGNADKTQERYNLSAPVILSGEQAIQGAAEQRRMVRTQLKKSSTEAGSDTARAWAQLNGGSYETSTGVEYCEGYDPHQYARAIHQFVLNSDMDQYEESWQTAQTHIYDLLSDHNIAGINGIELVALTMVKWGIAVYRMFAHEHGAEPPITDEDVEQSLLYLAHQMGEGNRTSHLEEFLALVNDVARAGELDLDEDYAVVNAGQEGEQLLLKLRPVHQKVTAYVNQNGLSGYDLLNDPNDYRSRLADAAENGTLVVDTSKYHRKVNRAIALDMRTLEETIDDFDSTNFIDG